MDMGASYDHYPSRGAIVHYKIVNESAKREKAGQNDEEPPTTAQATELGIAWVAVDDDGTGGIDDHETRRLRTGMLVTVTPSFSTHYSGRNGPLRPDSTGHIILHDPGRGLRCWRVLTATGATGWYEAELLCPPPFAFAQTLWAHLEMHGYCKDLVRVVAAAGEAVQERGWWPGMQVQRGGDWNSDEDEDGGPGGVGVIEIQTLVCKNKFVLIMNARSKLTTYYFQWYVRDNVQSLVICLFVSGLFLSLVRI